MHLEEFAEGSTLLHRLDPRVKFLAAGPVMVLTAVMPGVLGPASALLLAIALGVIGKLDIRKLFLRLAAVNVFIFILWLFIPFSYPGETLFSVGPFVATQEGASYALSITLKTNALVLMTIAVFGTSEAFALAHALVHLKIPAKLVYLFFFVYRYVGVLHDEYTRLRHAMAVRGFRAGTNMLTYKAFGYLIGMLLVKSYERSRRIYNAMLCRGFHGHFPIASHFHLHKDDIWFSAAMLLIAGGLAWWTFWTGMP